MRLSSKKIIGATMLACALGCGGGSNNDQGNSFSLIGFNAVTPGSSTCSPTIFTNQIVYPLSGGTEQETSVGDFGVFQCSTVQNNMTTQSVRTDRVLLSYYVEGAAEQPPTTTVAVGKIFGPVQVLGGTGPISSFPTGGNSSGGNTGQLTFHILPPAISTWLSLNRSLLPEPPFDMIATAQVSAVTSAGDRIASNPADLTITIVEDNLITPTTSVATGLDTATSIEESAGTSEIVGVDQVL